MAGGVVVGRANLAQFGGMEDIIEEEVISLFPKSLFECNWSHLIRNIGATRSVVPSRSRSSIKTLLLSFNVKPQTL